MNTRMIACSMVITTQGMADKDGIAARVVQGSVGLVDQIVLLEGAATIQIERTVKVQRLGYDQANGVSRNSLRHCDYLSGVWRGAVYWWRNVAASFIQRP